VSYHRPHSGSQGPSTTCGRVFSTSRLSVTEGRKLTTDQEAAIRALARTRGPRSLAADLGVSHETARTVVRRDTSARSTIGNHDDEETLTRQPTPVWQKKGPLTQNVMHYPEPGFNSSRRESPGAGTEKCGALKMGP
jgi:hypothetical protein